ncbi:single-pass membrane and coiled-coil domain-containing protein 3-like [Saccostrea cucullata]|uniref:single-pass membrane and coiled-coil domain-containing protein 3-like n=1 Tax=Saccostrea cuccullata TaxID=36930 RepID=UPI002ED2A518
MAFVDVLYPGNQTKRTNCVKIASTICFAIESVFDTTNDLIKIMDKRLRIHCQPVFFNTEKTVKENVTDLQKKFEEIQTKLDEALQEHKKMVNPKLYAMLANDKMELSKIYEYLQTAGKVVHILADAVILVRAVVNTCKIILFDFFLSLGTLWFGTIALGLLVLGGDLIYSAIIGAREQRYLETTEAELKSIADNVVPASRDYMKEIVRIGIEIENIKVHYLNTELMKDTSVNYRPWQVIRSGYDWAAGNAHTLMASDPTSSVSKKEVQKWELSVTHLHSELN